MKNQIIEDAEFETIEPAKPAGKTADQKAADKAKADALIASMQKADDTPAEEREAATEKAEIVALVERDPGSVLTSKEKSEELLAHVSAEIAAFKPDLSTQASRSRIASFAYKITRTKTALDDAGKQINAAAREAINKVDERRRQIREELDKLSAQARAPLTEWETKEAQKAGRRDAFYHTLKSARAYQPGEDSSGIEKRIQIITDLHAYKDDFDDEHSSAMEERKRALDDLSAAYVAAKDSERKEAELAEARQKAAEQEAELERERSANRCMSQILEISGKILKSTNPAEIEEFSDSLRMFEFTAGKYGNRFTELGEVRSLEIEKAEARISDLIEKAARDREKAAQIEAAERAEREQKAQQEKAESVARKREEQMKAAGLAAQGLSNAFSELAALDSSDFDGVKRIKQDMAARVFNNEMHGDLFQSLRDQHASLMSAIDEKLRAMIRQRDAEASREAQTKINSEARAALMEECGLDKEKATEVVKAIYRGNIPHISLQRGTP